MRQCLPSVRGGHLPLIFVRMMLPNDWPRLYTTDEKPQTGSDCQHRLPEGKADLPQPYHCWKAAQLMVTAKLQSGNLTIKPELLSLFTMVLRLNRSSCRRTSRWTANLLQARLKKQFNKNIPMDFLTCFLSYISARLLSKCYHLNKGTLGFY